MAEREAETGILRGLLSDLLAGVGAVILISGEAGIGKSVLLEAFMAGLPSAVRVWQGRCDDLVAADPLGPLRDAWASESLDGVFTGNDAVNERDQHVHRLLNWVMERIVGGPPTVLAVEDLHWSDEATADVLGYLARRVTRYPLLMVLTYRPGDAHHQPPVHRFLAGLPSGCTRPLPLAPLTVDAVAELCRGSEWDAQELHHVTGGNPFFVTETLAGDPDGPLPPTVTAAVEARVHRLRLPARQVLERVSVWPGVLKYDVAEALLGPDFPALEEAEAAGILVAAPDGIRFRHELARRAVEASLPGLRRRRLERQIVEVLVRRDDADLARLAHHAIAGSDAATVAAVAPQAAAMSARAGAHRQALVLYRAALDHEPLLDRSELAATLDGYAWELYNARRFAEAVEHGWRAVSLHADRLDHRGQTGALVRLSRHLMMHGDPAAARRTAARAVGLMADDDPERSRAMVALGSVLALTGGGPEAHQILEQARTRAVAASQPGTEGLCLNYLSLVAPDLGDDERIAMLRHSRELALRSGEYEVVARSHTNLAELLYRFGRYQELTEELEEGSAFTTERGFWSHAYNLEVHAALITLRRGDGELALARLRDAAERFDDPGILRAYAWAPYARLRARRGDPEAGALLTDCWEQAKRHGLLVPLGFAGAGLMEWAWLHADTDLARRILTEWAPHAARPTAAPIDIELRRYAQYLGVAAPSAVVVEDPGRYPFGLGLQGRHRDEADRWATVGDGYEQALELAETGEPLDAARSQALLRTLGAHGAASRVPRTGAGSRRGSPAGLDGRADNNPAGLTKRQLEVLRLMEEGMTNVEIADALYVSVRTVDHHVSTILTKLGVPNRRAAARAAREWSNGSQ